MAETIMPQMPPLAKRTKRIKMAPRIKGQRTHRALASSDTHLAVLLSSFFVRCDLKIRVREGMSIFTL